MTPRFPLIISSPFTLQIALALVFSMIVIHVIRRIRIKISSRLLIFLGAILLALAAGRPIWNLPRTGSIAVMVDLSPSTRGATFRDRAALNQRIHDLLGDLPFQIFAFSDHVQPLPLGESLPDLSADQTQFNPPVADAILLFSDGQYSLPTNLPPTYPVIDPVLNHPADAAVVDLQSTGDRILATVINPDPARMLNWNGAIADKNQPLIATPTSTNQVVASLPPGDRWPENDSLSINLPPPATTQLWWIGSSPPAGWRKFSASQLPTNPADFLQPSIIVLNNIAADAFTSAQQQHLLQYVRDLGGALLIVGGNHAFAAGNYDGTWLETLSPLSSSPPLPTQRWLLLIDGSGSMAGEPWQQEIAALASLIPQLPPHDPITLGSFARSLSLWPTNTLPSNISPTGPTNLAPALQQIAAASDGSSPTQLLLMTDADTELPNPIELAAQLNLKKIHLHLLALGQGSALPALQSIAALTNGTVLQQLDPRQWVTAATQLLRTALPDHYQNSKLFITPAPPASVSDWNQTWIKTAATTLQNAASVPLAARWQMGLGQVIALAYPADPQVVLSFAKRIAHQPKDPRFKVSWEIGPSLTITVDAIDRNHYLNGQSITLELNGVTTPIPQSAPGEYQIAVPSPRMPQIATVRNQDKVLERFAVAGRYPPEFNAIGNDLKNLKSLADASGGSLIQPGPVHPIDFRWPTRQTPLFSEFAFAGFLTIGAGMILNKRGNILSLPRTRGTEPG